MFSYVYRFDLNNGLPKSVLISLSYQKLKIKSALSLKQSIWLFKLHYPKSQS